jgi:hypothetical protein
METRTDTQFSVFLVNKPGVLAQVTKALAEGKVNVVAMTLVDSQEHGVLRVVADDAASARAVLRKLNLPMTETEVLCLDLSNRPGALADVATVLGQNHVNINYAYCTSGAPGGRTTGIFKVADVKKAQHVLRGKSGAGGAGGAGGGGNGKPRQRPAAIRGRQGPRR